jgi:hypothetical protein
MYTVTLFSDWYSTTILMLNRLGVKGILDLYDKWENGFEYIKEGGGENMPNLSRIFRIQLSF